jgi:glycyl-tRNA synthetase alpha subunit
MTLRGVPSFNVTQFLYLKDTTNLTDIAVEMKVPLGKLAVFMVNENISKVTIKSRHNDLAMKYSGVPLPELDVSKRTMESEVHGMIYAKGAVLTTTDIRTHLTSMGVDYSVKTTQFQIAKELRKLGAEKGGKIRVVGYKDPQNVWLNVKIKE